MTGWNMPPGVNVNDIPGNRPEDLAYEAFWDKLYEEVKDCPDDPPKWFIDAVDWAFAQGQREGYDQAQQDNELAKLYDQEKD